MNCSDIFKQRYSVREFISKKIEKQVLLDCFESARLAPSACNVQPWKFVVVDDEDKKNQIVEKALSGVHSFNQFAKTAPCIIAVVSEPDLITNKLAASLQKTKYYLFDIGIASEHLILSLWEKGIGSCYIGWFKEKAVKKILNIPWNKKVVMLIVLGYFEKKDEIKKQRKEIEKICSFNQYN